MMGHPKGAYIVAFAEMWERFSFYTMQFLLVLFIAKADDGLHWSESTALRIAGMYTFAVYCFPVLGSYFADKYLGLRRSALLGASIMMVGHIIMIFSKTHPSIFFLALFCVSLGCGFFKPCFAAILGTLYERTSPLRDTAYNYFYMAVNIGGLLAGIVGGAVSMAYGYEYAFLTAAAGMFISLCTIALSKKHLLPHPTLVEEVKLANAQSLFPLVAHEKNKIKALFIALFFSALFCLSYNIANSGTLTLYINDYTDRTFFGYTISPATFNSFNPLFIIVFTPLLAFLLNVLVKKNIKVNSYDKIFYGLVACGVAYVMLTFMALSLPKSPLPVITASAMIAFIMISTLGELLVSPIMISLTSQLSPHRSAALFQSGILVMFGVTGFLSGEIGTLSLSNPSGVFACVAGVILFFAAAMLFVKKKIERLAASTD